MVVKAQTWERAKKPANRSHTLLYCLTLRIV
jgi:hypothetical protein